VVAYALQLKPLRWTPYPTKRIIHGRSMMRLSGRRKCYIQLTLIRGLTSSRIEQALVIILGSVPTVKPLYDYFRFKRPLDASTASSSTPAVKSKTTGSTPGISLTSYKKYGVNTTMVSGDDDEGRLWQNQVGHRDILVGNSYEVSSLNEARTDRVSARESV